MAQSVDGADEEIQRPDEDFSVFHQFSLRIAVVRKFGLQLE